MTPSRKTNPQDYKHLKGRVIILQGHLILPRISHFRFLSQLFAPDKRTILLPFGKHKDRLGILAVPRQNLSRQVRGVSANS